MKKAVIAASLAALMSTGACADALGLYVGGQYWANKATGEFGEPGNLQNFNFKDKEQGSFHVAFEHPLPIIPNVKIAYTKLDTDGTTKLTNDFEFGGITLPSGSEATTQFNVNYVDYTFYYEVFSNDVFAFDFGLTARDISADINVTASKQTGKMNGSQILPMLYVSTAVGLPFTGFKVFADGNFLTVGDHSVYDYEAGISYALIDNIAIDLDIQLGYRSVSMKLEDIDDLSTDLKFEGAFLGAVMHF